MKLSHHDNHTNGKKLYFYEIYLKVRGQLPEIMELNVQDQVWTDKLLLA